MVNPCPGRAHYPLFRSQCPFQHILSTIIHGCDRHTLADTGHPGKIPLSGALTTGKDVLHESSAGLLHGPRCSDRFCHDFSTSHYLLLFSPVSLVSIPANLSTVPILGMWGHTPGAPVRCSSALFLWCCRCLSPSGRLGTQ